MITFIDYREMIARGLTKYSRDHLRRRCYAGLHPKPVVLSRDPAGRPRRIAWIEDEVVAHNSKLVAERDANAAD
jgi:hypothetical protein